MPGMDMIDRNDLVSTLYEPCGDFAGDGSPVCERCGWLGRRACRRHLIGYADRFFAAGFVAFPFFFPGCLIAFFGGDFFPVAVVGAEALG